MSYKRYYFGKGGRRIKKAGQLFNAKDNRPDPFPLEYRWDRYTEEPSIIPKMQSLLTIGDTEFGQHVIPGQE
jgi:hypothetical protein